MSIDWSPDFKAEPGVFPRVPGAIPIPLNLLTPEKEAEIRASERAAVLREVREAVEGIEGNLKPEVFLRKILALFEPGGRFGTEEK